MLFANTQEGRRRNLPMKPDQTSASRCAAAIRTMILVGELLPGERLHQEDLASRMDMSRVPVREALSTLESEGLIVHRANTGYVVAKFSRQDLDEIYLMRRLLETELLRTVDIVSVDVDALIRLNTELSELSMDEQREEWDRVNREFHFHIFEYSPMLRVREEVDRLWRLSTFYRALSWSGSRGKSKIIAEHESIIDAIKRGDVEGTIGACDSHRHSTEDMVSRLSPRRLPTHS